MQVSRSFLYCGIFKRSVCIFAFLLFQNKDIEKEFIKFLSTSCKEMYRDIMTKFYFVPYLYVNRNTYKVVDFAGEKVFITQPCSKTDLSHDKAMQTILHNLHLLAEDEKEVMFVISQFKYDTYLTTSVKSYHGHRLPMPDTLRENVKDYGDFDLLIVHRQHGLVVAVVEACGNESGENTETTEDTKLQEEIRNGAKRLKNAEHMIQYLLSDTPWDLPVSKTLMLPNVSQQTVIDVMNKQNKGKTGEKIVLTLSGTDMSKVLALSSQLLYFFDNAFSVPLSLSLIFSQVDNNKDRYVFFSFYLISKSVNIVHLTIR